MPPSEEQLAANRVRARRQKTKKRRNDPIYPYENKEKSP
jgi:hypothetical protein